MHLIIKYLIYMLRQIRLVLHLHFDRFVFSSSCHVFFFQVPIFHSKKKKRKPLLFLVNQLLEASGMHYQKFIFTSLGGKMTRQDKEKHSIS